MAPALWHRPYCTGLIALADCGTGGGLAVGTASGERPASVERALSIRSGAPVRWLPSSAPFVSLPSSGPLWRCGAGGAREDRGIRRPGRVSRRDRGRPPPDPTPVLTALDKIERRSHPPNLPGGSILPDIYGLPWLSYSSGVLEGRAEGRMDGVLPNILSASSPARMTFTEGGETGTRVRASSFETDARLVPGGFAPGRSRTVSALFCVRGSVRARGRCTDPAAAPARSAIRDEKPPSQPQFPRPGGPSRAPGHRRFRIVATSSISRSLLRSTPRWLFVAVASSWLSLAIAPRRRISGFWMRPWSGWEQ
jgi:hypothetical protein